MRSSETRSVCERSGRLGERMSSCRSFIEPCARRLMVTPPTWVSPSKSTSGTPAGVAVELDAPLLRPDARAADGDLPALDQAELARGRGLGERAVRGHRARDVELGLAVADAQRVLEAHVDREGKAVQDRPLAAQGGELVVEPVEGLAARVELRRVVGLGQVDEAGDAVAPDVAVHQDGPGGPAAEALGVAHRDPLRLDRHRGGAEEAGAEVHPAVGDEVAVARGGGRVDLRAVAEEAHLALHREAVKVSVVQGHPPAVHGEAALEPAARRRPTRAQVDRRRPGERRVGQERAHEAQVEGAGEGESAAGSPRRATTSALASSVPSGPARRRGSCTRRPSARRQVAGAARPNVPSFDLDSRRVTCPSPRRRARPGAVASKSPDTETRNEGESAARCPPGTARRDRSTSVASKCSRAVRPAWSGRQGDAPGREEAAPEDARARPVHDRLAAVEAARDLHLADPRVLDPQAAALDAEGAVEVGRGGACRPRAPRARRGRWPGCRAPPPRPRPGRSRPSPRGRRRAPRRTGRGRRRRGRRRSAPGRAAALSASAASARAAAPGRSIPRVVRRRPATLASSAVPSTRKGSVLHSTRRRRPLAASPSPA